MIFPETLLVAFLSQKSIDAPNFIAMVWCITNLSNVVSQYDRTFPSCYQPPEELYPVLSTKRFMREKGGDETEAEDNIPDR